MNGVVELPVMLVFYCNYVTNNCYKRIVFLDQKNKELINGEKVLP